MYFAIAEVDDGYTVVEYSENQVPEEAALDIGGTLIDPGPYQSYEEACDALDELGAEDDEYE